MEISKTFKLNVSVDNFFGEAPVTYPPFRENSFLRNST